MKLATLACCIWVCLGSSSSMAFAGGFVPSVSYVALSDAARKSGTLARYDSVPLKSGSIKIGGYICKFSVPRSVRAYDVIPVRYTLRRPAGNRRAALDAVAWEDAGRAKCKSLYDLNVPGDMRVKVDYIGSVSADFLDDEYIPLTTDPKTPTSPFPPFKRDSLVCSSTIRQARGVWFKFKLTNVGDTILDPEGFGAWFQEPRLVKLHDDGSEEWFAGTVNFFQRQLLYMYPGDSEEMWVNFNAPKFGNEYSAGLKEGRYRVDLKFLFRSYRDYDWAMNIWSGEEFARFEMPIDVTKGGAQTPVRLRMWYAELGEKMPGYFERFEEFMSSFRTWRPSSKPVTDSGTIYLQVAPWTKQVTLKLVLTDPKKIAVARVPISVTDETLKVKYNPKNVMVIKENGREEPVFVAQAMPGMRAGFQLGPYPEQHMLREIEEMKSLGVNLISNTCGGWWISELKGRKGVDLSSACYKYWYDVLARKAGMKLLGWSIYPPSGINWYDNAEPVLGRPANYSTTKGGYASESESVDLGDPIIPEVIAAWTKYDYGRWGDMYFKTKDGRIPIEIEDSMGWMRDDINVRNPVGPLGVQKFRNWVKSKYGTIERTNEAWGSKYKDFAEIDPQANQGTEGDGIPHNPVYNKKKHVFHDWSKATEDWDVFRTQLRLEIYSKANAIIRKTIPGAELSLRTEGANLVIKGDGKSNDMHLRHAYYSQRRNAMVYDVVKSEDVVHFYSDYITLPYTEDEWRQAMREMVSDGVIPMFLPQFDHMRDILLNTYYGREYEMHYGLDKPTKGMMAHCLMAAYPWWKATYEEGGAPGILWSDYLCDGFATETQKRELKLLRSNFNKMRR